jgi:4-amino-4-deoxy-L-arabinose transferase-like glycosyltransferase
VIATTAGVRVAVGSALVLFACLAYSLLVDATGALELAHQLLRRLTVAGLWTAAGAVATVAWSRRRDWASLRLVLALLTLFGTGVLVHLRAEPYRSDRLLPGTLSILVPMALGAVAAVVFGHAIRELFTGPRDTPAGRRRLLAAAIAIAFALASPLIWLPVIQNWNASGWMDSHGYDVYAHNILSGKIPQGTGQYMPVYQYGLAAVYYFFGHFFFAQQLANVALAFLTIALLCLAAWNLFGDVRAVLLIGVWAAFARPFVYAVHFTQIESWYMPIVAFGILAWTCYWRTPSVTHLVIVAIAAAVGINTRNQGAFYFGWLCLAPVFVPTMSWRHRTRQVALALAILAASLVPWSIRNYVVDGRLSPGAARNAYYLAVLNDPRIGFYGVRYWEGWHEIIEDYERRYPNVSDRDRAMTRAGLSAPFKNPAWFRRALLWRTLAFYGLLPPGLLASGAPVPTDWKAEWRGFVYWRTVPLLLIPLSLVGLVSRPGRTTIFLAGAVLGQLAASALSGGAEPRVSYPVLPLHMLMGLAAIFPFRARGSDLNLVRAVGKAAPTHTWITAAACLAAFLVLARIQFGRPNLYAPQAEPNVFVDSSVELDPSLPLLNEFAATSTPAPPPKEKWAGRSIRLRLVALNYQCPPKFGSRIPYMPAFATDPARETYYYATLLVPRGPSIEHLPIAVSWFGATINERAREGDEIEAEGVISLAPANQIARYWVHIDKARKVTARTSDIPVFF